MNSDTTLLIISGFPGVGKTTISNIIADNTNYVLLDKDTICQRFIESLLKSNNFSPDDRESNYYNNVIKPLEYKTLIETAVENLKFKNNVMVVAPFISQLKDSNWIDNLNLPLGVRIILIYVKCDELTQKNRLTQRNLARDTWKITNWESYYKSLENFSIKSMPHIYFEIDSSFNCKTPLEIQINNILATIINS